MILEETGTSPVSMALREEKRERWDACILVIIPLDIQANDAVLIAGTSAGKPLETHPQGCTIYQLPDHLMCMMPSPGILTEDQLSQVVELVFEFQDVFVGPDRKLCFTDKVKHEINTYEVVL